MAFLSLALFLSILPADACKQRDTTVFYRKKADIVLFIVYSNATIFNTAGRAPVPITVSPSKPPMNTTTTTHAISHYLSGSIEILRTTVLVLDDLGSNSSLT